MYPHYPYINHDCICSQYYTAGDVLRMVNPTPFGESTLALPSYLTGYKIYSLKGLDTYAHPEKVTVLLLDSNNIQEIPPFVLSPFKNVQTISIAENQINYVAQNAFQGLNKLSFINLDYNKLTGLHQNTFKSLPLNNLDLSNNDLGNLPSTIFEKLPIKTIDIQKNYLARFKNKEEFRAYYNLPYTTQIFFDPQKNPREIWREH